jgi:uncharacterized protein (UPF0333 family)
MGVVLMQWISKLKKDQKGSATLEFLGIVPIALILLVVIWQFIVGINSVLVTNSAANEYATVYSITKSKPDADKAMQEILNSTGNYLSFIDYVKEPNEYDKEFTVEIKVGIELVFLPKKILGATVPIIEFPATAHGRVIE